MHRVSLIAIVKFNERIDLVLVQSAFPPGVEDSKHIRSIVRWCRREYAIEFYDVCVWSDLRYAGICGPALDHVAGGCAGAIAKFVVAHHRSSLNGLVIIGGSRRWRELRRYVFAEHESSVV